jgi:hypothetical protein
MVRATRKIASHALPQGLALGRSVQGQTGRRNRGASRSTRAFDHLRRPGKANFSLPLRTQAAAGHCLNVGRVMRQSQLTVAG